MASNEEYLYFLDILTHDSKTLPRRIYSSLIESEVIYVRDNLTDYMIRHGITLRENQEVYVGRE